MHNAWAAADAVDLCGEKASFDSSTLSDIKREEILGPTTDLNYQAASHRRS